MIRQLLIVLLITCLAFSSGRSQFPPDHWLISDQSNYCVLWNPTASGVLGALSQGGYASNCVDGDNLYIVDSSGNTFAYDVPGYPIPGLSLSWFRQSGGLAGPPACVLDRKRLWMLTRGGILGYLNRDGTQGLVYVTDVFAQIGVAWAVNRQVSSACTNGRDIFFSISVTNTTTHHIYALDVSQSPVQVRPIAQLPVSGGAIVPRRGAGLHMGPDGTVMVLDQELKQLDPLTGAIQTLSGAYWISQPPIQAYWNERAQPFAYNVWSGQAIAGANADTRMFWWDGTTWFLRSWLFNLGLMTTTSPIPFLLFGKGCVNSLGREPRIGWRDLPRQGQSFTLTLRDAEPNGLAIFWVGGSDAQWPGFGPLPFDTGILGAPGCRVYCSSDMSYFVPVDAAGRASQTVPVPLNPALSGYEAYAQSASTSGGNVLGLAASDAVAIRVR